MNQFNFLIAGLVVLFAVQLVSANDGAKDNGGLVGELDENDFDEADGGYGNLGGTPRVGGSLQDIYGINTLEYGNAKLVQERQSVGCRKVRFNTKKCEACCATKQMSGRIDGINCTCFQKASA